MIVTKYNSAPLIFNARECAYVRENQCVQRNILLYMNMHNVVIGRKELYRRGLTMILAVKASSPNHDSLFEGTFL